MSVSLVMFGKRCGIGEMVKRDSHSVLSIAVHCILINYLTFKN